MQCQTLNPRFEESFAFKMARQVAQMKGETDRQIMVRRTRGYHGVAVGGTSLQGIEANREGWGDLLPHVVEIDPDAFDARVRLSELLERSGDAQGAIDQLHEAARLRPGLAQIHYRLAALNGQLGRFDEAQRTANQAAQRAAAGGQTELANQIRERAARYSRRLPWRTLP